jgi:hypothetical protein
MAEISVLNSLRDEPAEATMALTPGWHNVKNNLSENGHEKPRLFHGMVYGGWISAALWLAIILALLSL